MTDGYGRTIDYLRLSVTDLCNLRCLYCMGPAGVPKKAHGEICSLEELAELAEAAVALGVTKIRLTGGEPLVRRGIVSLVRRLAALEGLQELTMTTNGCLLPELAEPLRRAGLTRINLSLDTLDPEKYRRLTRGGELEQALRGLEAAEAAGFSGIKLNAVLLGGFNTDELRDLAGLARNRDLCVRFIELMPLGVSAALPQACFVPAATVLQALPELEPAGRDGVACLYRAPGWRGSVGLIAPMSCCFCSQCSRIRITADGKLKPCLHSDEEYPLRGLHGPALREAMAAAIRAKPERHELDNTHGSRTRRAMHEIGG